MGKDAGYSAQELKGIGFTFTDLGESGFGMKERPSAEVDLHLAALNEFGQPALAALAALVPRREAEAGSLALESVAAWDEEWVLVEKGAAGCMLSGLLSEEP